MSDGLAGPSTPPRDDNNNAGSESEQSDEDYVNRSPIILPPIRNHRRVSVSSEDEFESTEESERAPSELTLASSSESEGSSSTLVGSSSGEGTLTEDTGNSSTETVLLSNLRPPYPSERSPENPGALSSDDEFYSPSPCTSRSSQSSLDTVASCSSSPESNSNSFQDCAEI